MRKKFATVVAAGVSVVSLVGVGATSVEAKQPAPAPNLVTTALDVNAATGLFDTVLTAATCDYFDDAIVDVLSARGQLTLFAPTDGAFGALGLDENNVCAAFEDDPAVLAGILTYHVAKGSRDAASVLDSTQIRMLSGDRVAVDAGAVALIDGQDRQANILVTDVFSGNGVIHAIDSVLLPPSS